MFDRGTDGLDRSGFGPNAYPNRRYCFSRLITRVAVPFASLSTNSAVVALLKRISKLPILSTAVARAGAKGIGQLDPGGGKKQKVGSADVL